jgi:hypothetical protein
VAVALATVTYNGQPTQLALGDLDGDGHPDLVASGYTTTGFLVAAALGDGHGGFAQPKVTRTSLVGGSLPLALADLDGDGHADLVAAASSVAVLRGHGDGTFAAPALYPSGGPDTLGIGDFDGDGRLDVVTANGNAGSVTVLLGKGDGTLGASLNFQVGGVANAIALADFNGDGREDIAASTGFGVVVLMNTTH